MMRLSRMIEPTSTRLKTTPPAPMPWPVSDREREREGKTMGPGQPTRVQASPSRPVAESRPVAALIEGIGCEPAEACLDGEAPLRRETAEP